MPVHYWKLSLKWNENAREVLQRIPSGSYLGPIAETNHPSKSGNAAMTSAALKETEQSLPGLARRFIRFFDPVIPVKDKDGYEYTYYERELAMDHGDLLAGNLVAIQKQYPGDGEMEQAL